jgi:hypothetical protein
MRAALVVAVVILVAGCEHHVTRHQPHRSSVVAGGYWLDPAPRRLATQCASAQRHVHFRVLCPRLLPRTGAGATAETAADLPAGELGLSAVTSVRWKRAPESVLVGATYGSGDSDPGDWSFNNPNYFLHFVVEEGEVSARELELAGIQPPQRRLGVRTIAGHRGELYDQVSYAVCGCGFGGHVTFIWHGRGAIYAASLHRWSAKPDKSVMAVLAALIANLAPAQSVTR